MAATTSTILLITISSDDNSSPSPHIAMLFSFTFLLSLTLFILISTVLYAFFLKNGCSRSNNKDENPVIKTESLPKNVDESTPQQKGSDDDPQKMARSLLLEILPPNSPEWDAITVEKSKGFGDDPDCETGSGQEKKRKKKRARKKRPDPSEEEKEKEKELVCSYPFTKASSATQRKIKQHYDQLVKSHGSTGLTLEQIGRFVNCLVDARNELQSKSDVIKRKFTITKALLCKADRSSIDRIRQQIYKLELEQKRLEEDAFVYNWLQGQIKVSPAYKKLIEISADMETKAKSCSLVDSADAYFSDISFEEFLAQEKKDAFWQKNGRLNKPCSG